jgi:hypothetical protein
LHLSQIFLMEARTFMEILHPLVYATRLEGQRQGT